MFTFDIPACACVGVCMIVLNSLALSAYLISSLLSIIFIVSFLSINSFLQLNLY